MAAQTFDHVVIGAGTAGGVLAARLTEDPATTVLLVEAGGSHRHPLVAMPAGWGKLIYRPRFSWRYETEPEPGAAGRRVRIPRGKVLGGSSSINGLLYVRGHRLDYERWVAEGATDWGWRELLPYFVRSEDQLRMSGPLHGRGGPLVAADLESVHSITRAMIEAARQSGLPWRDDFNDGENEGCGMPQINVRNGRRVEVAVGALEPALQRPNLALADEALVTRIIFDGRRAVGVRYRQGGVEREARVRGEVLLCGGAINSPQLLMLSGVGPAEHLRGHGIEVHHALEGVGQNLHDHCVVATTYKCRPGVSSLNEELHGWRMLRSALRYQTRRTGVLASPAAEFVAFLKSEPLQPHADLQVYGLPISGDIEPSVLHGKDMRPERFAGFTLAPALLRPHSRGSLRLRSTDPGEAPAFNMNYLADERDRRAIVAGLRWARRMAMQPALVAVAVAETRPGPDSDSDTALLAYASGYLSSGHHAVGSCRLGRAGDRLAVVDAELRVRGLECLRVADASVMPSIISGNTNATCAVIGEKCADLVRGRPAPAPLNQREQSP
jgi:choline dehydrogenase